jgi:type II secretory pathway pseudopilin PulG
MIKRLFVKFKARQTGDTIVEVLIAIAVAGFAIGTSYAIANNSLKRAISAREHNDALNLIQNQISFLKAHYADLYYTDPNNFNLNYAVNSSDTSSATFPVGTRNFCFTDAASARADNAINNEADTTDFSKYTGNCVIEIPPGSGAKFYVNIAAQLRSTSPTGFDLTTRTVYRVTVVWSTVGGALNSSVIYYRF